MIADWISFVIPAVCGAAAVVSVFEGTRRLAARDRSRNAALMLGAGALFCAAWGGLAYWDHWTRDKAIETLQQRIVAKEPPVRLAKLPAAERERLARDRARTAYIRDGSLETYRDRRGAAKAFTPTQADIRQREAVVYRRTQLEQGSRESFADAFQWWIWGLLAALFGYLVSRERRRAPGGPTPDGH